MHIKLPPALDGPRHFHWIHSDAMRRPDESGHALHAAEFNRMPDTMKGVVVEPRISMRVHVIGNVRDAHRTARTGRNVPG